jgi:hypothetical protein
VAQDRGQHAASVLRAGGPAGACSPGSWPDYQHLRRNRFAAMPVLSANVVSKSALYKRSENLAAATRGHGVMVFAIDPGLVRMVMSEAGSVMRRTQHRAVLSRTPHERGRCPRRIGGNLGIRVRSTGALLVATSVYPTARHKWSLRQMNSKRTISTCCMNRSSSPRVPKLPPQAAVGRIRQVRRWAQHPDPRAGPPRSSPRHSFPLIGYLLTCARTGAWRGSV